MRRWIQLAIAVVCVIGLCTLLSACSDAEQAEPPVLDQSVQAGALRSGQQIFAMTCAACHGSDGEGEENWMVRDDDGRLLPPPLNGEGHTWHHSDGLLYAIVSEGGTGVGFGSNMPAFKDQLTHEEIITVLDYVKSLWEDKSIDGIPIQDSQRELSETDPYPEAGG